MFPREAVDPGLYTRQMAALWHVPFFDAIPQSTAYKVFLLTLALVSTGLVVWGLVRRTQSAPTSVSDSGVKFPWGWILFALSATAIFPALFTAQVSTFGAGGTETLRAVGLSGVLFIMLNLLRRKIGAGPFTKLLWVLLVVYLATMIIPGFLALPSLESDLLFKIVDWHFDAVVGGAEQLRDGMVAYSDILPLYGLAGPGFIGMLELLFGRMDFAGHIRLVQVLQVAFLLLALLSFHLWSSRSSILVFTGAALIGPYMATSNGAILLPNLSGWRFIGLPLAVLLFLTCRGASINVASSALGVLTGFLLLHSPEIAILVAAGSMVFLLTQRGSKLRMGAIVRVLTTFTLGSAVLWAIYLLLHRLTFGEMPANLDRLFDTLLRISGSGFSGSPLYYDPTFVMMAILGAYRCASMYPRAVRRGLSHRERVVFAISVMSLLWLAYYVNRAFPVNLWAQLYFLPFLLPRGLFAASVDSLRFDNPLSRFSGRFTLRTVTACVFIGILGPLAVVAHTAYFVVSPTSPLMRSSSVESKLPDGSARHFVSGVAVSSTAATLLRERTAFLQVHEKEGVHVVTKLPYTTRLMAGSPRVWVVNPFNQWNEEDFAPIVKNVLKRQPRWIVFDSANDRLVADAHKAERYWQKVCDRFRRMLTGKYRSLGENSGWEVWELAQ
ncbi:hypothetical protein DES53_115162 [Roseimicrobium gellanilyticum]|uniref:Dolichyl-phosphate-mannose-protein mannosyltransferase n=2 Tax=Roseimicrobium gellanilyticum TaxID=748857 RepID=A0A366H6D6_9BACT|nr:hypothetical protein DES53_115162 [Roseimicrobium gellanilyticum]